MLPGYVPGILQGADKDKGHAISETAASNIIMTMRELRSPTLDTLNHTRPHAVWSRRALRERVGVATEAR